MITTTTNFSLFPDVPQNIDMNIFDFINTPKKVTDWLHSLSLENIKEVALLGGLNVINGSKKEVLEHVINQLLSLDKDYKELISKAALLGSKAFNNNKKSVPILDKELFTLLENNSKKFAFFGFTLPILESWITAWHKENINNKY